VWEIDAGYDVVALTCVHYTFCVWDACHVTPYHLGLVPQPAAIIFTEIGLVFHEQLELKPWCKMQRRCGTYTCLATTVLISLC
jgi:hypothetical protein